jgi:choline dehydrogenase-like flavoprotein
VTNPIVVVGSGASGAHFALTALESNRRVLMLDVGYGAREGVDPTQSLNGLKRNLKDPASYFLGNDYQSVILPGNKGEYYGFPPSKQHVFRANDLFAYKADGFSPLVSFATGGLAETWTGGCYPFDDSDLSAYPFTYRELEPYYSRVAKRIGLSGVEDDLAAVFPVHDGLQPPLELDAHAARLMHSYERRRTALQGKLHCRMGRARVAVLSRDLGARKACNYLGRCLWGCPSQSLYTPSITINECRAYPKFQYLSGMYVDHLRTGASGRIQKVVAKTANGQTEEFPVDSVVLAAGTLGSAKIFLESMYRESGTAPQLSGLMDNRQILMPFVNLGMLGRQWNPDTYQFHQLAMSVNLPNSSESIHGLITTLKTALIHPLVQTLPFDLGCSLSAFRSVHGALGLINVNLPDNRRNDNTVSLDTSSTPHRLSITYRPDPGEPKKLAETISHFRRILWKLGCFAPSGTIHTRPMGASVHYAGTIPMRSSRDSLTCSVDCKSHDFDNLYFVDGTPFPSLPAKNLTFTLMANATRVAERMN